MSSADVPTPGPDEHRRAAVSANHHAWTLLTVPSRSADEDEDMVRSAYAAAHHWQHARGAGPENEARAAYLVAKVLLLTGHPEGALRSADRSLRACEEHGLADFDLAYAHEIRARALAALDREDEAAWEWVAAVAVPIADPDDRALVEADFADRPV
ncbi:hypothetical protein JL107_14095 [Nakamurella flavida]|uniref:Tetratricopeptide repeat protein n=1 Tax=Nakamurella flavida TaxID=363630 RepID=A0A938YQW3_9ACTN|nr:hypothetical protein [Nakamurella flavida]MBM9477578.1 hypothetical protein [Nakamurella flavida]MDP9779126.1 hypothetical protein [Nakamurella flavida]